MGAANGFLPARWRGVTNGWGTVIAPALEESWVEIAEAKEKVKDALQNG